MYINFIYNYNNTTKLFFIIYFIFNSYLFLHIHTTYIHTYMHTYIHISHTTYAPYILLTHKTAEIIKNFDVLGRYNIFSGKV